MIPLDRRVASHAVGRPGAPALEWGSARVDYATLEQWVGAWSAALAAAGMGTGSRVLLALDKGPAWVAAHLGLLRLGAVSVPVNTAATVSELAGTVALVRPELALCDAPRRAALEQAVPRAGVACRLSEVDIGRGSPPPLAAAIPRTPGLATPPPGTGAHDLAALLTTSGTTGRPKAVMLSHRNLAAGVDSVTQAWAIDATDRLLHVLPLFHVHGLFVALHGALARGACVLLEPRFDADAVWQALARRGVTVFMGVPTMYHRLIERAPDPVPTLDGLRLFTCGSAPLPAERLDAFERLCGHRILERYGLTEAGMVSGNPLVGERRAGTVGHDLPDVRTRLMDPRSGAPVEEGREGEVQVRGPAVFPGYLDRPDATREAFTADGWLRTGDLGRRDPAGALVICGRIKELVISGGYNVHPAEVEAVLASHPAVSEAGVCGLPDDDLGERVAAAVVWSTREPPPFDELLAFCRERLAPYKCPRVLVALEALPRNAMGKLTRAPLAEAIAAALA